MPCHRLSIHFGLLHFQFLKTGNDDGRTTASISVEAQASEFVGVLPQENEVITGLKKKEYIEATTMMVTSNMSTR